MKKIILSTAAFLALIFNVEGQHTFVNVAPQLGITGIVGVGHSVSWGDIDNDGDPDLGLGDQLGNGYWFFRNDSSSFADITGDSGLNFNSANKTYIAEFTGDNYNDILLRNFDGFGEYSRLYKNNDGNSFTNITNVSMLPNMGVYNIADFNNDGNLDLLSLDILNFGNISLQYGNGDGTFQPLEQIGVLWGYTPLAVLDYDRDGFMDIFWPADAAVTHPTTLLKNNGDGTFSNVTESAGIEFNTVASTMDVGDINNDGYIDIYIGGSGTNGKLFLNNTDGTFTDISATSGIFTGLTDTDRTATFGDFDNDGWLDLFISWKLVPTQLFRNNGDNTFTDVAASMGLGGEAHRDFFGSGWADYNNDCALDIFAAGHFDTWVLFENQHCPGNGLYVTLIGGTNSNYNAIGARADLWINGQRISRNVLPDPGIQDFSQLRLHFGMGTATEADSLVIYWPSGEIESYTDALPLQCNIEISEDPLPTGIINHNRDLVNYGDLIPNPATDNSTLRIFLQNSQHLQASLYTITGEKVIELVNGTYPQGKFEFQFPTEHLTPGIYLIHVITSDGAFSIKMIKQ